MNVSERIRILREKAGYSQNILAELAGISQSHLRRVELGQSRITVDHLQMICDALGISLKEFFDYTAEQDEFSEAISNLSTKQKHLLIAFLKSL
ncbi:MAG: helix-turn-helix transcriptional regulator [Clostridia bacterium]|nr:helix-turn-helix transcriptional regulator [Clostridia bacterium]